MKCTYCSGDGYDPHDTDPLGGSMYSECPMCRGTGLSEQGRQVVARLRIETACDEAWEKNGVLK
jgi:DnaJ-class molecular chaperone